MKKTLLLTTVIVLAFGLLIVWANQESVVSKDNSTHSKSYISKAEIDKDAVQNKQSALQAEQTFEQARQAAKLEELREKERLAEEEVNRPEIRLRYEPPAILATGDDCTNPIVIAITSGSLPYTTVDSTCGRGNNYDATCLGNYDGGEDIMYEIINTDAADIVVDIVMTTATTYTGMAIDMVCPPGDPCMDYCTSSGSGGCSLYGITLTSGVSYYLMIDTWPAPDCIPQFDLLISNATPPWDCFDYPPPGKYAGGYEYEPNDTCTFANQANCEHAYCGDIMPDADEDWWIITLPVDGWYSLHIRVFGHYTPGQYAYGGGLDPKVSVYDIDCITLLLFNDDYHGTFPDAESYDSQIDTSEVGNCFPPGSNLFINVEGYGSTSTGPYLLVINCYPCEEPTEDWDCDQNPPEGKLPGGWETEPNDNCPLEANEALCEYAYCGDLSTAPVADTVDWWYVDIPDDGFWHCLHVRVFGDDTPYQYAYGFGLDPNVGLYYPDCNTLDVGNDDYGGTFPDAVNWDSQINCNENCYPPGSTVYIKINSMWQDYGPYLLIINCDTCSVPEDPECPPNSMFQQLPILPDAAWYFGVSDLNFPLIRYDNYIVDNEICDIHWWGLELTTAFVECVRYPNMFNIDFYDDITGQPGTVVCSYQGVIPTRVGTGLYYSGYQMMYYSLDLDPCCPQLNGWVSIVGTGDPDCLFWWAGSYDGDNIHYSSPDGTNMTAEAPDLAFCLTGPPPEPFPNFHNIDGYLPADGDPIGTAWHELYPIFCQNWTLTSWIDNGDGILSYCDYVDFVNDDSQQWAKYHVEWVGPTLTVTHNEEIIYLDFLGDNPLIDPIDAPEGTGWYEKYPNYGNYWTITYWEDNGSGYLDFCDWIFIYNDATGDEWWVHIENFETDISLRPIIQPPPPPGNYDGKNYDNLDGYLPTDPAPVGTAWHEVWPNWCVDWQLTSWMDCNGSGLMDSCDITDWTLPGNPFYVSWEHVIWVGPTIVVEDTSTAADDLIYFEVLRNTDYNTTGQVGNPIDNWFWEVNPNYCTDHYCVGWVDSDGSGFVDYCDYILLESFSAPYDYRWYHVVDVRTDVITEPLFFEGYNFHNTDGYIPLPQFEVLGTIWHELWPTFCQTWELVGWRDNTDGILSVCDTLDFHNLATQVVETYHIEWIGPTITVEIEPGVNMYLDMLSSDYATMEHIFEPLMTLWFEKYPDYKVDWWLTDWNDNGNGYLDSCDYITLGMVHAPYDEITVHVIDISTDISMTKLTEEIPPPPPRGINRDNSGEGFTPPSPTIPPEGTFWHELWPHYCDDWHLTSWMDCNGSGRVDSCDITDWTPVDADEPFYVSWEHVIWVGPTIGITHEDTPSELFTLEINGPYDYYANPAINPLGTYWTEISPDPHTDYYGSTFHCESDPANWEDNGSGELDSCDYITLYDMGTETYERFHVEWVHTNIITEPLFYEGYNFHNIGGYLPIYGNPIETIWHELWPTFCQEWMCTRWVDNTDGILSVCDTVDFLNLMTEDVETYHIKWIGPTITVDVEGQYLMYLDMLSSDYATMEPIFDPIGTLWFEKYPDYKVDWWLVEWIDNGNGYLDSCDYITLGMVHAPYDVITVHVIDISTDISMTKVVTAPPCFDYLPGDVNMALGLWPPFVIGGDVTYLVNYFKGSTSSQPCLMNNPTAASPYFWASADANGDCIVMGSDVVRMVAFFRGTGAIMYCPDYEPCWPPIPGTAPAGWPNCVTPPPLKDSSVIPSQSGK